MRCDQLGRSGRSVRVCGDKVRRRRYRGKCTLSTNRVLLEGDIDFVRPHAGHELQIVGARVGEIQNFGTLKLSETNGKPVQPHLKTLNVNLVGAIYSKSTSYPQCLPFLEFSSFMSAVATQLALHHLPKTRSRADPLKYVVLLGYLGISCLVIGMNPAATFLTMISVESVVDCAPRSRDLRHLSTRITRFREIDAASSYTQ